MTKEDRERLLKDLGGRLPYGVKILDIPANVVGKLFLISTTDTVQYETADDTGIQTLYNIKPYLLPLSSMTEEQKREYNMLLTDILTYEYEGGDIVTVIDTDYNGMYID